MKDLTSILPSELVGLAEKQVGGYWKLPHNVYITDDEGVIIAIIDSAIDETLVLYWSEEENTWFHYTNCFGIGMGGDDASRAIISEWFETASESGVAVARDNCGHLPDRGVCAAQMESKDSGKL